MSLRFNTRGGTQPAPTPAPTLFHAPATAAAPPAAPAQAPRSAPLTIPPQQAAAVRLREVAYMSDVMLLWRCSATTARMKLKAVRQHFGKVGERAYQPVTLRELIAFYCLHPDVLERLPEIPLSVKAAAQFIAKP